MGRPFIQKINCNVLVGAQSGGPYTDAVRSAETANGEGFIIGPGTQGEIARTRTEHHVAYCWISAHSSAIRQHPGS
jgi:hypothetical protein